MSHLLDLDEAVLAESLGLHTTLVVADPCISIKPCQLGQTCFDAVRGWKSWKCRSQVGEPVASVSEVLFTLVAELSSVAV